MASRLARRLVLDKFPHATVLAVAPLTLEEMSQWTQSAPLRARLEQKHTQDPRVRRKNHLERVGIELPTEAIGFPRNLRTVVVDRRRHRIVAEA